MSPTPVFIGRTSTLSAAGSTDDRSASGNLTYRWNRLNGGSPIDATGPRLPLRYKTPGARRFMLTVTDEAGNSATKTLTVQVFRYVPCNATSVDQSGDFRVLRSRKALRGVYCGMPRITRGPDVVSTVFRGPKVVLLRGLARGGGTAQVFVDGVRRGTISFAGTTAVPTFRHRRVFGGLGAGTHRIEVRMVRGRGLVEGFLRYR